MHRAIERLREEPFDVLVVGGGVQGVWIALRAAQSGYRVALIEKHDFGAATSANSLNILHGGLRYLQHLDFARMRSSIRARREFARRFPHLVRPLPCVIPLQMAGVRSPWFLGPALLANDLISFDRNSGVESTARLPAGRLVSAARCVDGIAPLATAEAAAGAVWWDLLSTDSARLVIETTVAAARAGAAVANRVQALEYLVHGQAVAGVAARDCVSGVEFAIRASVVVNATGPWAGQLSNASGLESGFLPPGWTGGLNIVLRRSLGIESAVALSTASKEADHSAVVRRTTRELFFVPWRSVTMVGTDYLPPGDLREGGDGPPPSAVEAFVAEISRVAPRSRLSMDDVAMTHWGLLPTEAVGSLLPRKAPILAAGRRDAGADGLVIVIGEKLTSAPALSRKVLQLAARQLKHEAVGSRAEAGRSDAPTDGDVSAREIGSLAQAAPRLSSRYGSRWPQVARYADGRAALLQRIHPDTDVLGVEVIHGIRGEMALSLDDLVLRRLGIGSAGHPGAAVLRGCAVLAAAEWGWSEAQTERAIRELDHWYCARTQARPKSMEPGS